MSNGQALTNLIIILVVFYFAAFFVAAEFAIVSVRKSALESALEAGEGNKRKLKLALNMVSNMNEYLSTTQVGVTTTGIILGWLGADTLATLLTDLLGFMPLNKTSIVAISAVLGVVILTYLEVVITEIVPKNISIDMPMKVMMFIVTPLHYFHVVFYPFVWLLNVSASGIVKLVGLKPAGEEEDVLSQNEILNISKNAVHGGAIDKDDFVYMQRAFDFNDKVAKDIMIDRTSLEVVDVTDTVRGVINKYLQKKFTRFPVVANNDKDKILGYVYIYDMIRQAQVDDSVRVSKVMRTIITVPEVTPIQKLLQSMVQKQTPIVVVLDEYGGTSGIVTDRDIYEELLEPSRMRPTMFRLKTLSTTETELTKFQAKRLFTILSATSSSAIRISKSRKASRLQAICLKITRLSSVRSLRSASLTLKSLNLIVIILNGWKFRIIKKKKSKQNGAVCPVFLQGR